MTISPWSMALGDNPSEAAEQKALFMWANMAALRGFKAAWEFDNYGRSLIHIQGENRIELNNLFAIPNGAELAKGGRSGAEMKAQGMRPGVPDVMLAWPRHKFMTLGNEPREHWSHGLFIEMKRRKLKTTKATSDEQDKWIGNLTNAGYSCVVCFGWVEAATTIQLYLS